MKDWYVNSKKKIIFNSLLILVSVAFIGVAVFQCFFLWGDLVPNYVVHVCGFEDQSNYNGKHSDSKSYDVLYVYTVNKGDQLSVTIPNKEGFDIDKVYYKNQDVKSEVNDNQFFIAEVKGEIFVDVIYKINSYDVTCAGATNGTISISENKYCYNSFVEVTVTPNAGYQLDDLKIKYNNKTETLNSLNFRMPAGDVEIIATFKAE